MRFGSTISAQIDPDHSGTCGSRLPSSVRLDRILERRVGEGQRSADVAPRQRVLAVELDTGDVRVAGVLAATQVVADGDVGDRVVDARPEHARAELERGRAASRARHRSKSRARAGAPDWPGSRSRRPGSCAPARSASPSGGWSRRCRARPGCRKNGTPRRRDRRSRRRDRASASGAARHSWRAPADSVARSLRSKAADSDTASESSRSADDVCAVAVATSKSEDARDRLARPMRLPRFSMRPYSKIARVVVVAMSCVDVSVSVARPAATALNVW